MEQKNSEAQQMGSVGPSPRSRYEGMGPDAKIIGLQNLSFKLGVWTIFGAKVATEHLLPPASHCWHVRRG